MQSSTSALSKTKLSMLWASAVILLGIGLAWLAYAWLLQPAPTPQPQATRVTALEPGTVAAMDSALFTYSPGWRVTAAGADPAEPATPFSTPAGIVTFTYRGRDLALAIAPGDYWAYLFVTVDDIPANQLPALAGNVDSRGHTAGYKPLYEPKGAGAPARWLLVHRAADAGPHTVRIEAWRGWGQVPLRGVAVDALPPLPPPWWPGVICLLAGAVLALYALWRQPPWQAKLRTQGMSAPGARRFLRAASPLAVIGGGMALAGVLAGLWWMAAGGIALLAIAGILRPALWLTALLAALPFAYGVKVPLLPGRNVDIVDLGVFGGLFVVAAAWLFGRLAGDSSHRPAPNSSVGSFPLQPVLLAALTGWALVAASAARYPGLALREWRTVFVAALLFCILLAVSQRMAAQPRADRWLLVAGWLLGATPIAPAGLAGYLVGGRLVSAAEGVARVQSFYDSPNNLALYLDRTLPVTVALALLLRRPRLRLICGGLAAVQGLALLLTFSKGSLLVGLPAAAVVLVIGGGWLLRQQGRPPRVLFWLAAAGLAGALLLAPFAGADRFQRLFDFSAGTGQARLLLWRSAWQMVQDFPLLGVGPDNFLYHYRSDYMLPEAWREPALNHPHNLVLDWWTRLGIPGLILGMAWLASGVGALVMALRRQRAGALMVGLLAGAAAALAHGLIDVSYALPDLMLVWVFMFSLAAPVEE